MAKRKKAPWSKVCGWALVGPRGFGPRVSIGCPMVYVLRKNAMLSRGQKDLVRRVRVTIEEV